MNTQISNTAYNTIANEILSNLPDVDKSYTAEIEINNLTYFVDIEYTVEYQDAIGGSYENREYEIISELVGEEIYITEMVVYNEDADSEYFATDAEINELYTILN